MLTFCRYEIVRGDSRTLGVRIKNFACLLLLLTQTHRTSFDPDNYCRPNWRKDTRVEQRCVRV